MSFNGNYRPVFILPQAITLTCNNNKKIHINMLIMLVNKYVLKTEGTYNQYHDSNCGEVDI
jgi:hypothetical protein